MARILVADDNSNIQKMVGLALKDQGIDVVAVGNGEAAVRKISDIRPDLVLADVFMPVRNGYEVCSYVKEDPSLAHIPVILLVGAFDPLDEQEAQRVGADGVLKKPFVPPDPLISMVKAALTRAGISYSGESPLKNAKNGAKASDLIAPRTPTPPPPKVAAPPPPTPEAAAVLEEASFVNESFVDDVPVRQEPVKIDAAGEQPLAFGNLLNTSAASNAAADEDDPGFVPTTNPATARDWKSSSVDDGPKAEVEASSKTWRRDAPDSEGPEAEAADPSATTSVRDWRETEIGDAPANPQQRESWQPTGEQTEFAAAANAQEEVAEGISQQVLPRVHAVDLSEASVPKFSGDAWAAAIAAGEKPSESEEQVTETVAAAEVNAPVEEISSPVESALPVHSEEEQTAATEPADAPAMPQEIHTNGHNPKAGWFSSPKNAWDAEAEKATQLAATWDSAVSAPSHDLVAANASVSSHDSSVATPHSEEQHSEARELEAHRDSNVAVADELHANADQHAQQSVSESANEATQALREAPSATIEDAGSYAPANSNSEIAAEAIETASTVSNDDSAAAISETAEPEHITASQVDFQSEALQEPVQEPVHEAVQDVPVNGATSAEDMDALVARVLAKMSPEMLQAVTREILKPVVKALVQEQLDFKK